MNFPIICQSTCLKKGTRSVAQPRHAFAFACSPSSSSSYQTRLACTPWGPLCMTHKHCQILACFHLEPSNFQTSLLGLTDPNLLSPPVSSTVALRHCNFVRAKLHSSTSNRCAGKNLQKSCYELGAGDPDPAVLLNLHVINFRVIFTSLAC